MNSHEKKKKLEIVVLKPLFILLNLTFIVEIYYIDKIH